MSYRRAFSIISFRSLSARRIALTSSASIWMMLAVGGAVAPAVAGPVANASGSSASRSGAAVAGAAMAAAAGSTTSLEAAATKAGETGRRVAISLIGLALAFAAIVLAFKRDFKEAAAVFAVGIVCVLLATPAGESMLRNTVNALVGS